MPITTTLNRIRAHGPCEPGWKKLLAGLGKTQADAEPLPFARIVEINGLDDALWCCRAEPQYAKEWRLFAVWCARQVEHLNPDPRVKTAIDTAERYAHGDATNSELALARGVASDAAWDALRAHAPAAREAARAAQKATLKAAGPAALEAVLAARSVAWAARADAGAALAAAWEAEWSARKAVLAARDASYDAQRKRFLEIVNA